MELCLSFLPTGISNLHDHRMSTPNDHELPSYESPIRGLEYQRSLERGKNQKWLSLFVRSGAKNASSMPMFFEKDDILGRVEIDLDKAESVKCVTITVSFDLHFFQSKLLRLKGFVCQIQGGTTFVGQDENIFLTETQTLWTPTAESGPKLKGKHSWPFKFVLKREVPMKEEKKSEMMYRLPPNFTETASPAYIDYKLIVTVHRGLLRVNQVCVVLGSRIFSHIAKTKKISSSLSTNLGYLPTTFPDPPSTLRRLAYQENTQLIGPDGDPQGWKVLTPVKVKGTLFSVKPVEVECTVCYNSPSYLRLNISDS
jgi:arrestin (S-antigen)-like protein